MTIMQEKKILWKYRHYLKKTKQGIVKFLKNINWNSQQVPSVLELIQTWSCSVYESLILLSNDFPFVVRCFAVSKLKDILTDQLFLTNMVQCIGFEIEEVKKKKKLFFLNNFFNNFFFKDKPNI